MVALHGRRHVRTGVSADDSMVAAVRGHTVSTYCAMWQW